MLVLVSAHLEHTSLVPRPPDHLLHVSSSPSPGFIGRNCEEYPDELDSVVKDTAKTGVVR